MSEKRNPSYNPEHFGLELMQCNDPNACYDFDILCFWATLDGRVFTASDAGCSCPTPFEAYEAETLDELLPMLERVGTLDQAERTFDAWNVKEYRDGGSMLSQKERTDVLDWIQERLARGAA